jgi:hypothetical protein
MREPAGTAAMRWSACCGSRCSAALARYEDVNDAERLRHDNAATPASCARLQSWQLSPHSCNTRADQGLVFFAYHAVPTNTRALNAFRHRVMDLWRRSLKRRSQRDRTTWERIAKLADDFLPKPRILHPWPHVRFAVNHPRWEPSA